MRRVTLIPGRESDFCAYTGGALLLRSSGPIIKGLQCQAPPQPNHLLMMAPASSTEPSECLMKKVPRKKDCMQKAKEEGSKRERSRLRLGETKDFAIYMGLGSVSPSSKLPNRK